MVTQNFGPEELDKASASNLTFEVNRRVCMQSRHIEEEEQRRSKYIIRCNIFIFLQNLTYDSIKFDFWGQPAYMHAILPYSMHYNSIAMYKRHSI